MNPEIQKTLGNSFIYLASPHTHPDYVTRNRRYRTVTNVGTYFASKRWMFYAPITMTHPMFENLMARNTPAPHEYWLELDSHYMKICNCLVVAMIAGWEESKGVSMEIEHFTKKKRPIFYINPYSFEFLGAED